MKFTILVDPSLIIINYNLSLSDLYLGVEQKVLKRNNAISLYDLFGHALAQNTLRRGHEFLQFYCQHSMPAWCAQVEKKIYG